MNNAFNAIKFFNNFAKRELKELECSELRAEVNGYSQGDSRIENEIEHNYPECLEISFYNWSTSHYSYRILDSRWILEGADLNGLGISTFRLMRREINNLKSYKRHVMRHNEANKSNCIVFGSYLVQCVNIDKNYWIGGQQAIFTITDNKGYESDWYGMSADDALNNAAAFLNNIPIEISIKSVCIGRFGDTISLKEYEKKYA